MTTDTALFGKIAFIGIGLIGSSLARAVRVRGLAGRIAIATRSEDTLAAARDLGLGDDYSLDPADVAADADLVMICTPLGAYEAVARAIAPVLKAGAIVSDVGSVKACAFADLAPHLPDGVSLVPGHPIAGTEHSGPAAGFADLFDGHWCILTPDANADDAAVAAVSALWERCGMMVKNMDARHHDQVLAITSHLPHLIAYTIVGTATDLEDHLKHEVIAYSAGGFRDFTRIAASDPVMWRDIFLKNKEAVLEILGRFSEDLTALQRAIRRGEGDTLEDTFARARDIRSGVIEAKQDKIDVKKNG